MCSRSDLNRSRHQIPPGKNKDKSIFLFLEMNRSEKKDMLTYGNNSDIDSLKHLRLIDHISELKHT